MTKSIDESALPRACYEIARITSWEHRAPQSTSLDAITDMAARYRQIALVHVDHLQDNGVDPNVLVRAVGYLVIHAVPPMCHDTKWFSNMLELIVQLVTPNVILRDGDDIVSFLRTLRDAIDRNITDAE